MPMAFQLLFVIWWSRVTHPSYRRLEKPEFYGENPIAKRFGMGFSQATVHALDRACTVASYEQLYHILENYYNTSFLFVI